jgi:ABC-2 type transport system ATP-binding protein
VGLVDQANAYARNLSGGMRRRLLLAKALVHRPQILVLDEPTAGVDITLREMLWQNVRALNRQGMTIILTTHYLEEAEQMCDEIAIINHGELVVRQDTRSLLSRADGKTLVLDTGGRTPLPPLADGAHPEWRADGRLAISYPPSRVRADQLLDALRGAGIPILDVATEQPDLEDVFVEMTRA